MVELCKVKHDGSHFVATPYIRSRKKNDLRDTTKTELSVYFDEMFTESAQKGLKSVEQREYIIEKIQDKFGTDTDYVDTVYNLYIKKMRALHERIKRFYDIAFLNKWTHFVTITYDDKKHDEETFETTLKKTFQNLHTRKGWNYAGVFERSPEEERKHFHGLFNIPEMVGTIEERKDYSFKKHDIQITYSNTYFFKRFGRNDFDELSEDELKYGNTLNYITKYIIKQNQKVVYSRGLTAPKYCFIAEADISAEIKEKGLQYVLYDDFDFDLCNARNIEIISPIFDGNLKYPSYLPKELINGSKEEVSYLAINMMKKLRKKTPCRKYEESIKKWYFLRFGEELPDKIEVIKTK